MNRRVRLANLVTGHGFIATSVLTICFQLLTEPALFSVNIWIAFAVLAFSQLGLFISLLGLSAFRLRSFNVLEGSLSGRLYWLRHRYDLLAMALSGLIATLLAQSALNDLGHTASTDLPGALGGALITHAVLLPVLAVVLGLLNHAGQTRREMNKTWGQIELALSRDIGSAGQPIEPTFRAVAKRVVDRLQTVKTKDVSELNERIQQSIAQAVQPVVRDLTVRPGVSSYPSPSKPKTTSLRRLVEQVDGLSLAGAPEWALMPALLLLPFYLELHGWLAGLGYAAFVGALAFGLAWLQRFLVPLLANRPKLFSLAINLAYFAVVPLIAGALEATLFNGGAFTLVPQLALLLCFQVLLADLFGAAEASQDSRDASAAKLRAELAWLLADINTREWFVRKLFARNQPGLAKGELASQIYRLQEANQLTLSEQESEALVTQLEYRIKHLLALPPHATDVRHEVDVAIEGWRAKASIRYTMDFETAARLQMDPVATLALTEVVRELVGLAVHLAKASGVDATALVLNDRELELTLNVHQDFLKPQEHFVSDMLASATRFVRECAHHFEYLPERTRAILKVRIPIRPSQR